MIAIFFGMTIEYPLEERSYETGDSREISITKVKKISWWCVTIVYLLGITAYMMESIETIAWEYHRIISREDTCIFPEPPLEYHMPESLHEDGLPEWDHPSRESKLSWIETPIWEKSRNQICTEILRHECYEPLSSSAIEESIMEDGNFLWAPLQRSCPSLRGLRILLVIFVLRFLHAKRILKSERKTIELKNTICLIIYQNSFLADIAKIYHEWISLELCLK